MDKLRAEYAALLYASAAALDSLAAHYARHKAVLKQHMMHVLLFVPETVDQGRYIQLVKCVVTQQSPLIAIELTEVDVSPATVKLAMQDISLEELSVNQFLERRIRSTDQVVGQISSSLSLLQAFPDHLSDWRYGMLEPLLALQAQQPLSLGQFETMQAADLTNMMFAFLSVGQVGEMLERVWIPRKKNQPDFDDALQLFILEHASSAELLLSILGYVVAHDAELGGSQSSLLSAILGACYLHEPRPASRKIHTTHLSQILSILKSNLPEDDISAVDLDISIDALLSTESLLRPNMLTRPVRSSATRLETFAEASRQFSSSRYNPSIRDILAISLADVQTQRHQLTRILSVKRSEETFKSLRQLLFSGTILTRLDSSEIDFALLKSCLQKDSLDIAKKTYITTSPRPLPAPQVEDALLQSFYEAFDNAADLSRKSLQPAADILGLLHPKHTNNEVRRGQLLADASAELATFKHDLYMPIELRSMTADSLRDLAAKALQSPGMYKRWRRLLGLLQNLKVALNLSETGALHETTLMEIVANAALAEDDLGYALVLAREAFESEDESDCDNGAWRVAYQVSKYPTDRLGSVAAQRTLVEQALVRCPADRLHTLLQQHERLHDLSGGGAGVPSFSRESSARSVHGGMIEMPKSLLQAAQAARAMTFGAEAQVNDGQRIRKRDQLAGLVGSSVGAVESRLTSGVSWLIGAE